jgi:hypothetical protein
MEAFEFDTVIRRKRTVGEPKEAPDVELYMERVRIICSGIAGEEFLPLVEQAEALTFGEDDKNLEPARELYQRAFDLFRQGYMQYLENPENYEALLTWKEETALPWKKDGAVVDGEGRPGVHEALFEGYDDCLSDYLFCLAQLADVYRRDGLASKAADCNSCAEELRLFAQMMSGDQQ